MSQNSNLRFGSHSRQWLVLRIRLVTGDSLLEEQTLGGALSKMIALRILTSLYYNGTCSILTPRGGHRLRATWNPTFEPDLIPSTSPTSMQSPAAPSGRSPARQTSG